MKLSQNRKAFAWLMLLITTAFLFYGIFYKKEWLEPLFLLSWLSLLYLIILKILVQLSHGMRLNFQTQMFDLKLEVGEWLGLSSVTTVLNIITPAKLGVLSRAYYLKSRYQLDYSSYLKLLLIGNFTYIAINASVAVLGLVIYRESLTQVYQDWYVMLALLLMVIVSFPALKKSLENNREIKSHTPGAPGSIFANYLKSVIQLMSNRRYFIYLVSELVLTVVKAISLFACVLAMGGSVGFPLLVTITGLLSVATVFNITPGNLGVTEVITVYLLVVIGLPTEIAISVAILSRVLSIFSQIAIANLCSPFLKSKAV